MIFEQALSSISQATWEKLYYDFTSHLFGRYTPRQAWTEYNCPLDDVGLQAVRAECLCVLVVVAVVVVVVVVEQYRLLRVVGVFLCNISH